MLVIPAPIAHIAGQVASVMALVLLTLMGLLAFASAGDAAITAVHAQ